MLLRHVNLIVREIAVGLVGVRPEFGAFSGHPEGFITLSIGWPRPSTG